MGYVCHRCDHCNPRSCGMLPLSFGRPTAIAKLRHERRLKAVQTPQKPSPVDQDIDWSRAEDGVLIAGAGIAGLAAAAALHKVGIPSVVVERDPGPRREGSAIALWTNAFRALDALDAAEGLREAHPIFEKQTFNIARAAGPIATLGSGRKVRAHAVLGADGTRSNIASSLKLSTPNYAGYSAYRGVAEFKGPLPIAQDTVRQMLGQGVRAGVYALSPTSIYWFVTMPGPASPGPDPSQYREDALSYVSDWKGGIIESIKNTPIDSFNQNRIVDRWLVPGQPFGADQITLAGDAAHPMTPNLGQGGCVALEDAVVLAQTLRDAVSGSGRPFKGLSTTAVSQALREYERKRSTRVTKVTVRSNLMGLALGTSFPPFCAARDLVVKSGVFIKTFVTHTTYDCGTL